MKLVEHPIDYASAQWRDGDYSGFASIIATELTFGLPAVRLSTMAKMFGGTEAGFQLGAAQRAVLADAGLSLETMLFRATDAKYGMDGQMLPNPKVFGFFEQSDKITKASDFPGTFFSTDRGLVAKGYGQSIYETTVGAAIRSGNTIAPDVNTSLKSFYCFGNAQGVPVAPSLGKSLLE